jgi:hypothetical protein
MKDSESRLSLDLDDEAAHGLLSFAASPRKRHRRQLSLSSFPRRIYIYAIYAAALAAFLLGAKWLSSLASSAQGEFRIPEEEPGVQIPIGQSRMRDGREVFWWEQFAR